MLNRKIYYNSEHNWFVIVSRIYYIEGNKYLSIEDELGIKHYKIKNKKDLEDTLKRSNLNYVGRL